MGGRQSGICALAAAFVLAGAQPSFELPLGSGLPVGSKLAIPPPAAAANCAVVVCSYVTKTIICHRLVRACAYQPSPPFQLHRHKSQ
jgi:hypothetical protein